MFLFGNSFYFITLGLQALCVFHCIRKSNQQKWIYIIVFLPLVGCIAYLFTEMFTGSQLRNAGSGLGTIINPTGSIRRLEANLRFADTFHNRVALADAYLAASHTAKAIELYEGSLTGAFEENEHVLYQLIIAYSKEKRYEEIIELARKIYHLPQFPRSKGHILFALALEQCGRPDEAEKEFHIMNMRFSSFEARYQYGLFLNREGRNQEATHLFSEMIGEWPHLSPIERRHSRTWIALAKEMKRKLASVQA
jgi:hypothetical protein